MMSNTPLNADELDNFMHELGFLWDSYQSVWRNDGRKQYDRDYDDSISMDLAKQLLADRKKHELQARIETVVYIDSMLRFENIPLHPVQAESLKQYLRQLEAQQEEV